MQMRPLHLGLQANRPIPLYIERHCEKLHVSWFSLFLALKTKIEIIYKHMQRKSDYPIQSLILNRFSPRAMSGELLTDDELMPLFEAARWAPSSYNAQPWRILYVKRETPHWNTLFDLLVDFNKEWCAKAATLLLFFSRTTFEHNGKPSHTHGFDTGAAWENLCLEGNERGLV